MSILVTGGTGVLGREVVAELLRRGVTPRVLSRRPGIDLGAGVGPEFVRGDLLDASTLPAAMAGVETLVHLASNPQKPAEDLTGTANLLHAAKAAGVRHIVLISIVGIDTMGWMPYYRAKRRQEDLVEQSGIPHTILRAAQFHEFAAFILGALGRGSVQLLPDFTLQPVQTQAVAERLASAALGRPAGRLPDLVGPEARSLVSLGREYLAATGRRKTVIAIPLPGFVRRLWRPVGGPGAVRAGQSWTQWLAENAARRNPYGGAA